MGKDGFLVAANRAFLQMIKCLRMKAPNRRICPMHTYLYLPILCSLKEANHRSGEANVRNPLQRNVSS